MRDACPIYGEVYCQPNPSALLTVANQLSDRLCPIPTSSQPEEYCQSLSGVASGTHTDEHGQPGECAELRASTSRRKRCIDSTNGPSRRLPPQRMAQRNTARRLCRKSLTSQSKIQHRYRLTSNFLRICSALVDSPEPSESSARSIFFLCSSRIACKHFCYSPYIQRAIFGFNTWSKVPFAM
jgi:hypothetical protein